MLWEFARFDEAVQKDIVQQLATAEMVDIPAERQKEDPAPQFASEFAVDETLFEHSDLTEDKMVAITNLLEKMLKTDMYDGYLDALDSFAKAILSQHHAEEDIATIEIVWDQMKTVEDRLIVFLRGLIKLNKVCLLLDSLKTSLDLHRLYFNSAPLLNEVVMSSLSSQFKEITFNCKELRFHPSIDYLTMLPQPVERKVVEQPAQH